MSRPARSSILRVAAAICWAFWPVRATSTPPGGAGRLRHPPERRHVQHQQTLQRRYVHGFHPRHGEPQAHLSEQLLGNFIVVPEHKLLFCYIEKVACANFNELFRRLRSRYDESQIEGVMWGKNSPWKHRLDRGDLEQILTNSSWHKAVFWRNPVERFVSAFLSKCGGAHADGQYHCKDQFRTANLSFAAAVSAIADRDLKHLEKGESLDDSNSNKHFLSMGHFCGGLSNTLQFYDTIEELDSSTSHTKVGNLLRTVGVDSATIPGFSELFPVHDPPHSALREAKATVGMEAFEQKHNTGSTQRSISLLPADQPWQQNILRRHYRADIDLFRRFSAP